MGLNVANTNSFQFENGEHIRRTVKTILEKAGDTEEAADEFVKQNFSYTYSGYTNAQVEILKAAVQINVPKSLKETKKYLQDYKMKNIKNTILGELWEVFETTESTAIENPYDCELIEYEVDDNIKNIFVAA